jgi:hypothetical protein
MPTTAPHTPLARVGEGVGDDGHGDRVEHRAADGLHHAEDDQQLQAGRERAQQRAEAEDHQARHEDPLAADPVGRGAGEHQQRRQHQRVGVDGPLQTGRARVQVALEGGQGDVQNGVVQTHDQQAHAADREHQQTPAVAQVGHAFQRSRFQ